jgi:anti-sigma B factor antagonist
LNASFSVEAETVENVQSLTVHGELDQATAPTLRGALDSAIAETDSPVLVDLSGCEFIDSTGLSLLVETQRRLTAETRNLAVCCPNADVRRLLELTGIDSAVSLFQTRDEALGGLRDRSGAI